MNKEQQNKKTKLHSFTSEWLGLIGVFAGLVMISFIMAQFRSCSEKIQSGKDKDKAIEKIDSAFVQRDSVINVYKQKCK